jgi:hypothetical protein
VDEEGILATAAAGLWVLIECCSSSSSEDRGESVSSRRYAGEEANLCEMKSSSCFIANSGLFSCSDEANEVPGVNASSGTSSPSVASGNSKEMPSGEVVAGGLGNEIAALTLISSDGGYDMFSGGAVCGLSLGSPVSSRGRTKRWSPSALCRREATVPSGISRAGRTGTAEGEKVGCWLDLDSDAH